MGRVMLCVGKYAQTPYYLAMIQRNVYCMEELCYSMRENAFLLDQSIVNKSLAEWIDKECGLPDLAKELYAYVNKKCNASVFVTAIMEYTAYCEEEQINNTRQLLKSNANLSDLEKRKSHADYLVQNKRYILALKEYDSILEALHEETQYMLPKLYHNKATALAGLFLFKEAARWFLKAANLGCEASAVSYLAASRLSMTEQEYIQFIAGQESAYELSLELEQCMEQLLQKWQEAEQGQAYEQLMQCRKENRMSDYYALAEEQVDQMKSAYRKMAL